MDISDKIRKTMNEGRLRAIVSITIDEAIAIHDIIVQGEKNVCCNASRKENGVFRDISPYQPRISKGNRNTDY